MREYSMPSNPSVSIHALLAECDSTWFPGRFSRERFNPRTPCGVRPYAMPIFVSTRRFQSTHSLRSATRQRRPRGRMAPVSIHALLAECDCLHALMVASGKSFNPRTPCGVRLFGGDELQIVFAVSIHALLAECDKSITSTLAPSFCFNPRTPCGVRRAKQLSR